MSIPSYMQLKNTKSMQEIIEAIKIAYAESYCMHHFYGASAATIAQFLNDKYGIFFDVREFDLFKAYVNRKEYRNGFIQAFSKIGLSQHDIAKLLNMTQGAVSLRLKRAEREYGIDYPHFFANFRQLKDTY